ncbi:hypothetical protein E4U09_007032 [Claviceps aff. purpurea]|uniref:Uncharacterized protein n=1 Tax=Claviceps aff. purpurea TaxID=1967640 RepID=A0A9P7QC16_9HYPO|nr:hypothetical protein E4U09_007032 [Claviceps aff. purpurea]
MSILPLGGSASIVYVTYDYELAACFVVGGLYRILPRMPSSPNQPEWLALYDPEGRHRGWIRRCDRLEIDEALTQAAYVYCRVEQRGRRWTRLGSRLDTFREWQEGIVEWWTASEEEELGSLWNGGLRRRRRRLGSLLHRWDPSLLLRRSPPFHGALLPFPKRVEPAIQASPPPPALLNAAI